MEYQRVCLARQRFPRHYGQQTSRDIRVYRFHKFKLIFIQPIDSEKFLMPHVKIYTHMKGICILFVRFVKKVEVLGHKSVCTVIARVKQLYSQKTRNVIPIEEFDKSHYCPKCRWIKEKAVQNVGRPCGQTTQTTLGSLKKRHRPPWFVSSEKRRKRHNKSETDNNNNNFLFPTAFPQNSISNKVWKKITESNFDFVRVIVNKFQLIEI